MALLDILVYPDTRLRNKAKPVEIIDDSIKKLAEDMAETMYAAPGIGLAATQVNVSKRIVVIDVSETRNDLQVFINPQFLGSGEKIATDEGCLSIPGVIAPVWRFPLADIEALDLDGKPFKVKAEGILAICIQHEIDHLNGKVFVDQLSQLKRDRIRKKLTRELSSEESNSSMRTKSIRIS